MADLADLYAASADPEGVAARIDPVLEAMPEIVDDPGRLARLIAIGANSRDLSSALAARPYLINGPRPDDSVSLRMRGALVTIAGDNLAGTQTMREATRAYSDSIDGLVRDTLTATRDDLIKRHPVLAETTIAVIALGKWGASELNFYSDIDLMFVHDAPTGSETEARVAAVTLAGRVMSNLSSPTFEGSALAVDADLRPEGPIGPLSRSLDSYRSYYERWGESWELQALLKARPAAGDQELGERFSGMAGHVVWETGLDPEALRSIRLIKARAEEEASHLDLKRAPGGIRDIEFTVQLLQMVHGRFDPDLRVRGTLEAIDALGAHGYIDDDEADRLATTYTFLRDLEHRAQLWDLRQTHTLPSDEAGIDRIGRSMGLGPDPGAALVARVGEVRGVVRDLYERLYFRPILDSLAGVTGHRLESSGAELRLESLGFRDVAAAAVAFEELTAGLSRRSRMMHQTLPLMIDWLSRSPDPDLGLAQLRLLIANSPDHSTLVTTLQHNPVAGERLCLLLGTGSLLGELMDRIPEFIPRLGSEQEISDIRDLAGARLRLGALIASRQGMDARVGTIRRFVRRRKLRIAARDVINHAPTEDTLLALSDTADVAMTGALEVLTQAEQIGFGVIAMGKWGGRELSYGSDIDLMYVYGSESNRDEALKLSTDLGVVLSQPGRHGLAYELDAELRPEGRKGPMARSVDSYRRYYDEWAEPWELLAAVKARPVAGDPEVLSAFGAVLDDFLWREVLPDPAVHEIRAVKARVESERIPLGEDPDFHLKLGPGGLSDIEFVTQLLQLRHGGRHPGLRVTGTLEALGALLVEGVLTEPDHRALAESYRFCTRVRLRLHLQRGRVTDYLPTDQTAATRLAVSLGFDRTSAMRDEYRRHTRRARRVFETLFYG